MLNKSKNTISNKEFKLRLEELEQAFHELMDSLDFNFKSKAKNILEWAFLNDNQSSEELYYLIQDLNNASEILDEFKAQLEELKEFNLTSKQEQEIQELDIWLFEQFTNERF